MEGLDCCVRILPKNHQRKFLEITPKGEIHNRKREVSVKRVAILMAIIACLATLATQMAFVVFACLGPLVGAQGSSGPRMVNVQDYGAIPNDGVNDLPAFDAAIAAAPVDGTVYVPAGTYHFENPLYFAKRVTIRGDGASSVLQQVGTMSVFGSGVFTWTDVSGVQIRQLKIRGDRSLGGLVRVALIALFSHAAPHTLTDVTIQNVTFENGSMTCVLIWGGDIRRVNIVDNIATEFWEQFVELSSGRVLENIVIARNTVTSTNANPDIGSTEPFGVVSEPHEGDGLNIYRKIYVFENTFDFTGMADSDRVNTGGVFFSVGPAPFLYQDIHITDNVIISNGIGIRIETLFEPCCPGPGSAVIARNRIYESMQQGIIVIEFGNDGTDHVSVVDNYISGYSVVAPGTYAGIVLDGDATRTTVAHNTLVAGSNGNTGLHAIEIRADVGQHGGALIADNSMGGYSGTAINNMSTHGTRLVDNTTP
jgi:hypothetical protein